LDNFCINFYVAGYFLTVLLAELSIQPLNRSVVFLKEKDIFLTNDAWRIAIDVDMSTYEEAVATIKANLILLEGHRKELSLN